LRIDFGPGTVMLVLLLNIDAEHNQPSYDSNFEHAFSALACITLTKAEVKDTVMIFLCRKCSTDNYQAT
jgi:hypothetical protein